MFVICLLNARGDYLLNLPAIRALAEIAPSPVVLVVRSGSHQMYLRDVAADHVINVEAQYHNRSYHFDPGPVAREVMKLGTVDTFVSLNPWSSSSLDSLLASLSPSRSVGLGPGRWTQSVSLDFSCHSADLGFRVVKVFDARPEIQGFSWPPAYPPQAVRFARELRDEVTPNPLLVIHRETKPPKEWPDSHWLEFLREWLQTFPKGTALDVSLKPLHTDDGDDCWDRMLHTLGLPLEYALAVTSAADIFVGVDSCFLHAADLARVPSVGLFFATEPHEFGLRWSSHHHLSTTCPDDLAGGSVLKAVISLTEGQASGYRLSGRATAGATEEFSTRSPGGRSAFRSRQGLQLSTIGLGTGRLGLERDLDAIEVVLSSIELGCNVIDLAGNYGGGDAAALVGLSLHRAIAQGAAVREEIFLCCKAGFTEHLRSSQRARARGWVDQDHCMEREYLQWEFERQCRWLGVSQLDVFLLQNPEEGLLALGADRFFEQLKSAFDLFEDLISQERLGFYGISTAEALRVPQGDPRHLDLGDISDVAHRAGGQTHGFRVLEVPVSVPRLEALEVAAHTLKHERARTVVPALVWASNEDMLVLGSSPLNGGWELEAMGAVVSGLTPNDDPVAGLLQVARSVPGVTTTLVGVTTPAHLASVRTVLGQEGLNLVTRRVT